MGGSGIDYRKFLQENLPLLVLPVTDPRAGYIHAPGRTLRLENRVSAPGYYQVTDRGRRAVLGDPAPACLEVLEKQPRIDGHAWGAQLVTELGLAYPLELVPEGFDLPRFAPVRACQWEDGTVLFHSQKFEGDAEEAARKYYEDGGALPAGLPASLRSALAYSLLDRAAQEVGVRWSPIEVVRRVPDIVAGGLAAARSILAEMRARLDEELARRRLAQQVADRAAAAQAAADRAAQEVARLRAEREAVLRRATTHAQATRGAAPNSVEAALQASGAGLLDVRKVQNNLEVRWRFLGQKFVSVVNPQTLNVVDSGICLRNHDRELTLWSLPSAIREAMDLGVLHIMRPA